MATAEPVLTLSDLETWSFQGTALAVVGHPIKHSISPAMHNAALAELSKRDNKFSTWSYFRFDIPPEDLPRALRLFHDKKFYGLNLTVPHKVIAFDLITSGRQPGAIDAAAQPIGAVNTLLANTEGWRGFNTDGFGLATGIREDLALDVAGANIILLGAGGAARGAAVELLQRRCASLWIANRTAANLETLLNNLPAVAKPGTTLHGFDPANPPADLPQKCIVINATSAGLRDNDTPPADLEKLPQAAGVYDMIYNPPQTKLLAQAEHLGISNSNGLSMLIHQGAKALSIWTQREVPVQAMAAATKAAMKP
ncbi:MAG: shikimate dehydrogenase [Nibricoccus sp.]